MSILNLKKLNEKKSELLKKMESIVDAGEEITSEQQAEFDSLRVQFDAVAKNIENVKSVEELKKTPVSGRLSLADMQKLHPGFMGSNGSDGNKENWKDPNGNSVKIYGHNEKMGSGEVSVGKFAKGLITGDWRGAENEREFFASTTTNLGGGGYAIPSTILSSELIDMARANMVLSQAGCKVVDLQPGQNKILRIKADPTAEVKTELESFNASTTQNFDLVEFVPMTIGAYIQLSAELAQDGQNFEQILGQIMSQAVAQKLDYLGLYGAGTTEPKGIVNYSGINTVDVTNWDYDIIIDGITACQTANSNATNAYVLSPATNSTLVKLKDDYGSYLRAPDDVATLSKYITTSMADTDLIVGDFTQLYLGLRQGITFEVNPYADDSFKKFAYSFRVVMRADWAVVRESSFTLCSTNIS